MQLDNGSVRLSGDNRTGAGEGDDESVELDLNNVPADIDKIVFAITINEADTRGQNFSMVQNAFARIVDLNTQQEFMRFNLNQQFGTETAVVVGEVYRHQTDWKFNAISSGFNEGLVALCKTYGVQAE